MRLARRPGETETGIDGEQIRKAAPHESGTEPQTQVDVHLPMSLTKSRSKMQTITSSDGTRIAFWKYGVGPPLVLVHGTLADHTTTWRFVLPSLSSQFTVYAMDRRGRGGSEDSPVYDLQREAEDVACLIDSMVSEPARPFPRWSLCIRGGSAHSQSMPLDRIRRDTAARCGGNQGRSGRAA